MKKIIFLLFLFLPSLFLVEASSVNLVFYSDPQIIKPGDVGKLTIRLSEGVANETVYFSPESSSPTGQFSYSSTWKSGSYYISRGDSSKSFYYKDTTEGEYVIKIKPVAGKNVVFEPIQQNIKINQNALAKIENNKERGSDETLNEVGDDSSAHTSPSPLSDYLSVLPKIGAGRERLATVKTPIDFIAYDNKKLTEGDQVTYTWSFGDGSSIVGAKVAHAYNFAGTYNVVLNANYNNKESAVARTKVTVLESAVTLGAVNYSQNYLEIINSGSREQNINGWFLVSGLAKYYFPLDTIINPQAKIKVPLWFLGPLATSTISLYYPNGEMVSEAKVGEMEELAVLQNKLIELKNELALKRGSALASPVSSAKIQNTKSINDGNKPIVLNKKQGFFARWRELIF